jgi:hypothetical protein
MSLTLAVAAAAAVLGATPIKIAAPNLNYVNFSQAQGDAFLDFFAQQLGRQGIQVTTAREIAAALGLERQKQLLGCTETSSSCLAELAGALGVDAILTGSIAQIGTGYTVALKVVRSRDAAEVASDSDRVRNEDALLDWLTQAAQRMGPRIRAAFTTATNPRAPAPTPTPPTASDSIGHRFTRADVWAPAAAAVVLIAGGAVLGAKGLQDRAALADPNDGILTRTQLESELNTARNFYVGGIAAGAVGVAALGIATWRLLTPSAPPVTAWISKDGVGFAWTGALP